jgi:hypothetical protein
MKIRGGFVMRFEEKKFVQITTLCERWDISRDRIYDLLSKRVIRAWHPEKKTSCRGVLIDVTSVLQVEASGYVDQEE